MTLAPSELDERALLHSVLRNADLLDMAQYVTPEDMGREVHAVIWIVLKDLVLRGIPVTPLTVTQAIRRNLQDQPERAEQAAKYVLSLHAEPTEMEPDEVSHIAENVVRYASMRRSQDELEGLLALARGNDMRFFAEFARVGKDVESLKRRERVVPWSQSIVETLMEMEAQRNGAGPKPVVTGIGQLDTENVIRRGEFAVLAGRPSTGKSAIGLQMALNAAKHGCPTLYVSLEMKDKSLVRRAFSAWSGVSARVVRNAALSPSEATAVGLAADEQSRWPLHTLSRGRIDFDTILSECRRLKSAGELGLLVVDYFGLVKLAMRKGYDKLQSLEELSASFKSLAVDLDIAVVLLSQLNRNHTGTDGQRPTLADLRSTGALEQDADVVLLLSANLGDDDYATWKNKPERRVLLDLAKARDGMVMDVDLTYVADRVRFYQTADLQPVQDYAPSIADTADLPPMDPHYLASLDAEQLQAFDQEA